MAQTEQTITVLPNSELAAVLDTAGKASVVLVRDGVRYRVIREETDPFEHYDGATVRKNLRTAGHISADEAQRLRALVQAGREEGTRPLTRP